MPAHASQPCTRFVFFNRAAKLGLLIVNRERVKVLEPQVS